MYLYDYHIHSLYSIDSSSTISDLCSKAVEAGLKEIAITDHFEPVIGDENYSFYKPEDYFADLQKVKAKFKDLLDIKYAIELGQPHLYPEHALKLMDTYNYDYVLASVHNIKGDENLGLVIYDYNNSNEYCEKYLEELKALAEWNRFDCIGHLDLIKRYAAQWKIKVDLMDHKEQLEEILKIIINNGKGIEINTSGLRQTAQECFPSLDIVKFYRQLGGEIVTVGSDAHKAEDVGKGIRDGIEIAKAAGFDHMTVFNKRKPMGV